MAHHWTERLARLTAATATRKLNRAERRQFRKLLGRRTGREWRSLGHQRVLKGPDGQPRLVMLQDDHFRRMVENTTTKGHVLQIGRTQ